MNTKTLVYNINELTQSLWNKYKKVMNKLCAPLNNALVCIASFTDVRKAEYQV